MNDSDGGYFMEDGQGTLCYKIKLKDCFWKSSCKEVKKKKLSNNFSNPIDLGKQKLEFRAHQREGTGFQLRPW